MSVPGADRRIESATAAERVKRGSTTMSLAPVVRLRFGHPLEAARMRFGGIAAHDQDDVGVLDVDPVVRHRTAAERRAQTGHRRSVSDSRLVIEPEHAEAADDLVGELAGLVGGGRQPARKPVVGQRLTVSAVLVFRLKLASRSSFIRRAMRSRRRPR